jgi:hypothetical protein
MSAQNVQEFAVTLGFSGSGCGYFLCKLIVVNNLQSFSSLRLNGSFRAYLE